MRNKYFCRIPAFYTTSFANQPFLMANRPTVNGYRPAAKQPYNLLPECIFWRNHSIYNITSVLLYNVDTGASTEVYDSTITNIWTPLDEGNTIDGIMIKEKSISPVAEGFYQYRITDGQGSLFYSELFEMINFTDCDKPYLAISWTSSCTHLGIPWPDIASFTQRVYMYGDLVRPEVVNEVTVDVNNLGQREILHNQVGISYDIQAQITADEYTALASLDGHVPSSEDGIGNVRNDSGTYQGSRQFYEFSIEPDYSPNEFMPLCLMKVKTFKDRFNTGCCDDVHDDCGVSKPAAPSLRSLGAGTWGVGVTGTLVYTSLSSWCYIEVSATAGFISTFTFGPYTAAQIAAEQSIVVPFSGTAYIRIMEMTHNCVWRSTAATITVPA